MHCDWFILPLLLPILTICFSLRVCSIGKSGFRFSNPDFGFAIECEIRKQILTLRYLFLVFFLLPFDWEIRKRIWKSVLKNSGLACARILSKKKTTVHENSFANPFSDFPIEWQKGKSKKSRFGFLNCNPPWGQFSRRWNPFSDFAFDWEIWM